MTEITSQIQPQPEYDLQAHNTLSIPSRAAYFQKCISLDEVQAARAWAKIKALPIAILGEGSNILLSDYINALVIQPSFLGTVCEYQTDIYSYIKVGAGENWHTFTQWCLTHHYYGLENLSLIPGSVGAAPVQNIGAYGVEVADYIESVTAIHIATGQRHVFNFDRCEFSYRDSVFKKTNTWLIHSVMFKLNKVFTPILTYPALAACFKKGKVDPVQGVEKVTAEKVSQMVIRLRQSKLPNPIVIPNAGSFFKNPIITAEQHSELLIRYPTMPSYPYQQAQFKIAAAWLLDQIGAKALDLNGVKVHDQQALVMTNPLKRSLNTIYAHAENLRQQVQQRFNIILEIEPQQPQLIEVV